ncbi:MAG: STAS domain-containing protein [Acidimicrobiales bacterium]
MHLTTLYPPAPPLTGFDVLVSAEGPDTVVALRGEADTATVAAIVDALAGVIADRDGNVIVDLAQTAFLDTAALRAVLRAREVLDAGQRELTLRSPSRIAGRLLAVFELSHLVSPAPQSVVR